MKEPTKWELQRIYRNNVCNRISQCALDLFDKKTLKKHIGITLYGRFAFHSEKNRTLVLEKISNYLNVHKKTVEYWCPSKKKRVKKAQKTPEK